MMAMMMEIKIVVTMIMAIMIPMVMTIVMEMVIADICHDRHDRHFLQD